MAERLSALAHLPAGPTATGGRVRLSEVHVESILQVQAWPGTLETVRAGIISELVSEDIPAVGSAMMHGDTIVCSLAPGRFMVAGASDLLARMTTAFPASDAAVTDLSHGRVILKIEGEAAAALLQRCVMLDLDPSAFPAGRVAQTMIHHIDLILHRRAEAHFELWVLRSFAESLAEWLLNQGLEYGIAFTLL